MLRRVKTVWLDGVLEESLHGGESIDLGFAYRPASAAHNPSPAALRLLLEGPAQVRVLKCRGGLAPARAIAL